MGKFLDCFRFSKISDGAQEISDEQFVKDYEWTDEMIEMKNKMNEMALENPVFDYYNGISSDVTDILDSSVNGIRATSRGVPWNESVNAIYDQTQNLFEFVPCLCNMDERNYRNEGGQLHRTKTLAQGDDCCDFHVTKIKSES